MLEWSLLIALSVSLVVTGCVRCYALSRKQLMDAPTARSSHLIATPRGGGVAIVCAFVLAMSIEFYQGAVPLRLYLALLGSGLLVAIIGFIDDHGHVSARWRLLAHFVAAMGVLFGVGGLPALSVAHLTVDLGWLGQVLAAIGLVWLLNLYNFMDGIDGIASIEAVCVGLGGALCYALIGQQGAMTLSLLLAASAAGFLFWNFPPARIFMGDAGSGFLGLIVGALLLQATTLEPQLLWAWLILLAVFIADASVTLGRRFVRKERLYEAHRSHAYQYAARRFGHRPVTLAILALNICWLLPIAVGVSLGWFEGVWALLVAYVPIVCVVCYFKAGSRET